jgi:hypothetical protein
LEPGAGRGNWTGGQKTGRGQRNGKEENNAEMPTARTYAKKRRKGTITPGAQRARRKEREK